MYDGMKVSPWCGDLDDDGDKDCLIGNEDGNIKCFRNTGSASSRTFQEATGAGNPLDAVNVGGQGAPWCGDMDDDGDKDCIIGNGSGDIYYFQNTGNASRPVFQEVTGAGNPLDAVDVGARAKPWCGNLDGDGDNDCFVGNVDGTIIYFQNTGSVSSPTFQEVTGAPSPFNGVVLNTNRAAPWCGDMDNDGDEDCFVGNYQGSLIYVRNWGGPESFCNFEGSFALASERCLCTPGYAGVQCRTVCPGGAASPCYGHGLCYDLDTQWSTSMLTGSCLCKPTFAGTDSTGKTTCGDCVTGTVVNGHLTNSSYFGANSTVDNPALSCRACPGGGTCSTHGTCSDGAAGLGTCNCTSGYNGLDCSKVVPCRANHFKHSAGSCTTCLGGRQNPNGQVNCELFFFNHAFLKSSRTLLHLPSRFLAFLSSFVISVLQGEVCEECSVGQFSTPGAACAACGAGQFAFAVGQSSCLSCETGRYQPASSQSTCLACEKGYTAFNGSTHCLPCPSGSSIMEPRTSLTDCRCDGQQYLAIPCGDANDASRSCAASSTCLPCPDGAVCEGTERVVAKSGWYALAPDRFQQCLYDGACPGGHQRDLCAPHYHGVLCSTCVDGFSSDQDFRCQKCCSDQEQLGAFVGGLLLVCVVAGVLSLKTLRDSASGSARQSKSEIAIVLTAITLMQSIGFIKDFRFEWPGAVKGLLGAMSWASGGAAQVVSLDCVTKRAVYVQLLVATLLAPVLIVLSLAVMLLLWSQDARHDAAQVLRIRFHIVTLVLVFLLQPQAVKSALQLFVCFDVDGESLLYSDGSINCSSANHK